MLQCRLRSKFITFSVPGKVVAQGRGANSRETFKNLLKIGLKAAMAKAEWEYSETDAVYIVLTAFVKPEMTAYGKWQYMPEKEKNKQCLEQVCGRSPSLHGLLKHFMSVAKGILIRKDSQVVSFVFLKKYETKYEGVDILIGKPGSLKELIYDLRNI